MSGIRRRGFIGSLLGAASAAVLDPEMLLWIPGRKIISIPAPVLMTAGSFLHSRWFNDEMLKHLKSQLSVSLMNNRDYRSSKWRIGDTVTIRRPARFVPA